MVPAPTRSNMSLDEAIVETWAQGFNVGGIIILILFVICNYSRGRILHKLILCQASAHVNAAKPL